LRRNADRLALEIINGLRGRIRADDVAHEGRRGGDAGDAGCRRALDLEGEIGAAADRDVDIAGDDRLLLLGAAAEIELVDLEIALGEEALRDADIERDEAEILRHHFADAQCLGARRQGHRDESGGGGERACHPAQAEAVDDFFHSAPPPGPEAIMPKRGG
jgi:hypothetical protein